MSWFINLRIRNKLYFAGLVGTLGFVIFLAFNQYVVQENSKRLNDVSTIRVPLLETSDANLVRLYKIKTALSDALALEDETLLTEAAALATKIQNSQQKIMTLAPDASTDIAELNSKFNEYFDLAFSLSKSTLDGNISMIDAAAKIGRMNRLFADYEKKLEYFRQQQHVNFKQTIESANKASQQTISVGIVTTVVSSLMLMITLYLIARMITINIGKIVDSLQELAHGKGDLTSQLAVNSKDETGDVVIAFNDFLSNLKDLIVTVVANSENLTGNSERLSYLTSLTSQGAEDQEHEGKELANSVNQLVSLISSISVNVKDASEAANEASSEADNTQHTIEQTVNVINDLADDIEHSVIAVRKLKDESVKIGDVVNVIAGIAAQTNLLALNAAIEAARAGESGRGFAVVADEVRNLAVRTQESTNQIREMVQSLQDGVTSSAHKMETTRKQAVSGVEQVEKGRISIMAVKKSVDAMRNKNHGIVTLTDEQNAITQLIETAIERVRSSAEQTFENSRLSADTGTQANELALELKGIMANFKV